MISREMTRSVLTSFKRKRTELAAVNAGTYEDPIYLSEFD